MSTVTQQLSRHPFLFRIADHTGDCRAVPKALLIEMTFSPAEFLGLSLIKGFSGERWPQTARSLHPDDRQNVWCLSLTLIWRCWWIFPFYIYGKTPILLSCWPTWHLTSFATSCGLLRYYIKRCNAEPGHVRKERVFWSADFKKRTGNNGRSSVSNEIVEIQTFLQMGNFHFWGLLPTCVTQRVGVESLQPAGTWWRSMTYSDETASAFLISADAAKNKSCKSFFVIFCIWATSSWEPHLKSGGSC